MQVELRIPWREIAGYLQTSTDQFSPLRIVNEFSNNSQHSIKLTTSVNRTLDIEYSIPEASTLDVDGWRIINGSYPAILGGETIEFDDGERAWKAEGLSRLRTLKNSTRELPMVETASSGESRIVAAGLFPGRALSTWFDGSRLEDYLVQRTWYGSPTFEKRSTSILIHALAIDYRFSKPGTQRGSACRIDYELPSAKLILDFAGTDREFVTRHAVFGNMPPDMFNSVIMSLRSLGVRGGVLDLRTIDAPWTTPGGDVLVSPTIRDELRGAGEILRDDDRLRGFLARMASDRRREQADKLSKRIAAVKKRRQVMFRGDMIAAEPSNEQETVAVFAKLEGARALPFEFVSWAWSSHEGIDVIADLRLHPEHMLKQAVPVEFEYTFSNFLAHRHPHEHVSAVVCWHVDDASLVEGSESTWLHWYRQGTSVVPVVEVVNLPGLTVEEEDA